MGYYIFTNLKIDYKLQNHQSQKMKNSFFTTTGWHFSFFALLLVLPFYESEVQDQPWEFKKDKDGIKIYTRQSAASNIKELKFTAVINSDMNSTVALLIDVENYSRWVYKCAESVTLKEISNLESYCYYNVDFPWPMSDRDMIVFSEVKQDPNTKIVTSSSKGEGKYIPEKDGLVRIYDHFNQWIFKPLSNDKIEVTYFLKSDPAGNIPAWAVNLAIDQGPVRSMKRFIEMLKDPKYKHAQVKGIVDFRD